MSDEKLKPCPFCGSTDLKVYTTESGRSFRHGVIRCRKCSCEICIEGGGWHDFDTDDYYEKRRLSQEAAKRRVVVKWNRRA